MSIREAVHIDPKILGGTLIFVGTRVSVKTLFDYLESSSLEDFLEGFPGVCREQAQAVIEWASEMTLDFFQNYESAA
ncbi:MAG: DUF433 domain-containing protein [Microscillaceae bacterium]|nr:DUF433 domain-containing protein [Microscillaceae bacterium]